MKNNLLFTALTISSLCFSQISGVYETDQNGKLFFQGLQVQPSPSQSSHSLLELNIDWSGEDFNLSENPAVDSWDVRLDVGSGGEVYVVYNDNHTNGLQKIMFRKKTDDQWSEPVFVDTGSEIGARNNHFPSIAVSPNGDLHVSYNVWAFENVRNYIGYSYYNAAANQWSEGVKISDLGGTVNHFTSYHDIYSTDDNLPVVVWGYDFRENQTNEEIYMTYFDGDNWSADVAVSDVSDGFDAGFPNIGSIGGNKAMIVYSETINGGNMELKYRVYDEVTHQLGAPKTITSQNIYSNNYRLVTTETGEVMVLTIYKATGPDRDVMNVFNYDANSDLFELSPHTFEVAANAGGLMKRIDMDCKSGGECGIVFTDFLAHTNSFMEYNASSGFGLPLIINEQNPGFDAPFMKFDNNGNVHVVWSDYRFDDGQGFDEREVFYEMGRNLNMNTYEYVRNPISIYPNPTNGVFTIDTEESYKIQILDLSGNLLQERFISGVTKINSTLPQGVYIVKFHNEKGTQAKKLLVK